MNIQLVRPVKKPYVVTFSYADHLGYARNHPLIKYNGGIDYTSTFNDEYGNPIYASYLGIVEKLGYDGNGYGNYVKLRHDWGFSLYGHMKKQLVSLGDDVTINTPIGYIGHTGMCFDSNGENTESASHVHFECRDLNNIVFDPTSYIIDREQQNYEYQTQENTIKIGSIVYIKEGAKSYNGTELWDGIYNQPYKVDEIYQDRVVLDYYGICTPVNINDIALYTEEVYKKQKEENMTEKYTEEVYYTVQSGDTLWGIAYTNGLTLDEIKSLNSLDNPNMLQIGQQIRIK